jgi:RNA polymerase sigma-70 factor (ECF subfamily)
MPDNIKWYAMLLVLLPFSMAAQTEAPTPSAYVGSDVCQQCHPEVWLNFNEHPHYESIASGKKSPPGNLNSQSFYNSPTTPFVRPFYDRHMDSGVLADKSGNSREVSATWDHHLAVGRAKSANELRDVDDDALMVLLLEAEYPQDIDLIFAELYSRYYLRVNGWCRRFMRDPHRADDTTQEVFMRAFRYRNSFRGEARTSTWLFSVTRNYCLTAIRKANSDPSTGAALLDPRLKGASGFEIQQQLERDQAFDETWRVIRSCLTPTETRVMVLHFGHEMPLALVTRQLGLTNPSGAKAYVVNAKRKLGFVLARTRRKENGNGHRTSPGAIAA